MNARVLATDYDGTIAWHGAVEPSTTRALQEFKDAGGKLLLVTGREIPDLLSVFSEPTLFDLMVAENGGLLYRPYKKETRALAPAPSRLFVDELRHAGVHPLSVGQTIVATQESYSGVVSEVIDKLALNLRIIMNKGAVMVLPANVNKASGLREALRDLHLSAADVVGVGDAENDFAFLEACGFSAAVANAIPALKDRVNYVTRADHGQGVEELIAMLLDPQAAPHR